MRRTLLAIAVVLFLAGAAPAAVGGRGHTPSEGAAVQAGEQAEARFEDKPAPQVYEGRIKDVRPVWGLLVLTVREGKKERDMRFDIGEARIVGPDGDEWKGQDLRTGARVRVRLTADGRLVQQVRVLAK